MMINFEKLNHVEEKRIDNDREMAKNLSNYFNSENFIESVSQMPDKVRDFAVGSVIQYYFLFPDGKGIQSYLEKLKNVFSQEGQDEFIGHKKHDIKNSVLKELYNAVLEDFQFAAPLDTEQERMVFNFFYKRLRENNFHLHGFNGIFGDSIQKDGLTTNTRIWDEEEIQSISDLGEKYNNKMLLGWYDVNCKGKIFFDDTPDHTYYYAAGSPEWFNQLVSAGFHISSDVGSNKKAFIERNYEQAKQNILSTIKSLNMSSEDGIKLFNFFEKYWSILAGQKSEPKVALVRRDSLFSKPPNTEIVNDHYKKYKDSPAAQRKNKTLLGLIQLIIPSHIDERIEKDIPANEIVIVDLPDYSRVHKK